MADFRITISNVKIMGNNYFKIVPDKLTGVASSIPARYHTFVEIDHEIISTVILLLPLIYSRRFVVSYKRKSVHKLLVKPAQEKCC